MALWAARIEENSPRGAPPAARTRPRSRRPSPPQPVAAWGGQVRGDIHHGLSAVVERAADVDPGPGRRTVAAQPHCPGDGVEAAAQLEGGGGEDDGAVVEDPLARQTRDAHGGDPHGGAAARVVVEPDDVELTLLEDARGVVVHLVDRGSGDLAAGVERLALLGLDLALDGACGVANPAQGEGQSVRYAEQAPSGSRSRAASSIAAHPPPGRRTRHTGHCDGPR